jgi:Protein of unknown function (DUF3465)
MRSFSTISLLACLVTLSSCNHASQENAQRPEIKVDTILPTAGGSASASLPDSVTNGFVPVATFAQAYASNQSNVPVSQSGIVTAILPDDNDGSRHQKFILRLSNGQTLLFAHNIDIAPRVPDLAAGQVIAFKGIYEWNSQGGVVHWTHRDPSGAHATGWLWRSGATYQ